MHINHISKSSNLLHFSSVEQLKNVLKEQVRLKADAGELYLSEYISKDISQYELDKVCEEFKKSGYKVKISVEEKLLSIFWN